MKKVLIFLLFLGSLQVKADDFTYLTFVTSDGTAQSFTAIGAELTFSDGKVVVTSGAESATFELTALSRMFFSNEKDEVNEDTDPDVVISGITATDNRLQAAPLAVYTLSGMYVGTFADAASLQTQLRRGLYVIKQNGRTQKIVVR